MSGAQMACAAMAGTQAARAGSAGMGIGKPAISMAGA